MLSALSALFVLVLFFLLGLSCLVLSVYFCLFVLGAFAITCFSSWFISVIDFHCCWPYLSSLVFVFVYFVCFVCFGVVCFACFDLPCLVEFIFVCLFGAFAITCVLSVL